MHKTFDPFEMLTKPFSVASIHNVQLLDVLPGADGGEVLVVEHRGARRELVGGRKWGEFSRHDVGRHGYLVPSRVPGESDSKGCYFRSYVDPTLRRVFEIDHVDTRDVLGQHWCGWICDAQPQGFFAPPGLIPGEQGRWIRDETVEVTLRVPPEFVRECRRVQMTPEQVLRGFVGDVAGIHNFVNRPRADGYGSNGSDERGMAGAWLERAYGMNAIDLGAVDAFDEEMQDRAAERDDFGLLMEDYVELGGRKEDLVAAVEALVNEQRKRSDDKPA
jgi:hypothetical protein